MVICGQSRCILIDNGLNITRENFVLTYVEIQYIGEVKVWTWEIKEIFIQNGMEIYLSHRES